MSKGTLEIHSENILPIIKRWLYSDKDIFVRELISNACDAIHKVKILRDQGKTQATDDGFRIAITINKDKRTLTFTDTGIGMDAEEVKEYIAQIAFSGAESFMEKYQTSNESDQFIGHFGLGFYSTYMVADKVEINTLSYKEGAEAVFWSCDGSPEYLLEKGTRESRGTEITLHISKDCDEFLDDAHLRQILQRYCSFLPYPITLNDQCINEKEPLWMKAPSECSDQDYLEFYRYLYPMQPDPLFWVHLNVDYPFHLQGILYFPKLQREMDLNKSTIKLFCNRVFVSDNCKEIIPSYLTPLQGVIDSPDIPLNVSRSYLQMDRTVRQLSTHIAKKVSDSLGSLYKTDRDRFLKCWDDVSIVVKLGAVEDQKFYSRVKEFLVWKNTENEWGTVEEYLERNRETTKDKIFYTTDEKHNGHFLKMYRDRGVEILCSSGPIDSYLINFLEQQITPAKFQRIDASIDDNIIDNSREKNILDTEGKTEAGKIADFIRSKLEDSNIEVEAKSLHADALPGFIMIDENQRRMREYMLSLDPNKKGDEFLHNKTFVVNTNSPLVTAIQKLDQKDPDLSKEMVHELYELAMLSQREIDADKLNNFIQRTSHILEKLTDKATE